MRENPTPNDNPDEQFFLGDNIKRKTGDTLGFENLNQHAFDAYQKGQEIHMQAAPSQAELLYKQYKVGPRYFYPNTGKSASPLVPRSFLSA